MLRTVMEGCITGKEQQLIGLRNRKTIGGEQQGNECVAPRLTLPDLQEVDIRFVYTRELRNLLQRQTLKFSQAP